MAILDDLYREEMKELLKQKTFRHFAKRLLLICNAEGHGYYPGSFDKTAFNCGQMSIGIMLKRWIYEADKQALYLMQMEYEEEIEALSKKAMEEQ